MKSTQIKILGSGTSTGIPIVGCTCKVCQSENPKDKRLRSSIFIDGAKKILIDTTPDLRTQLLAHQINHVDFVVLTHEHADHLHGIDDLRPLGFARGEGIPFYAHGRLKNMLTERFPYIFNPSAEPIGGGIPNLSLRTIDLFDAPLELEGEQFTFFELPHGRTVTLGVYYQTSDYKFAYLIDCHKIPQKTLTYLKAQQIDFLIIDCVTVPAHRTHLNRDLAFNYIEEIAPKRAGLIHMGHHLAHEELERDCRERFNFLVAPLFDGEIITLCPGT